MSAKEMNYERIQSSLIALTNLGVLVGQILVALKLLTVSLIVGRKTGCNI